MTHASPNDANRHDTLTPVTSRSGRGTARQTIRIDEKLWERFGAQVPDGNRSDVIRDFIRWYVHDQGAKMPKRPGAPDDLPPGITTYVDDVSPTRPAGRTWYGFTTASPMNAFALSLVDEAGGQLAIDTASRQVTGRSLASVRRAYDALRAAGYRIVDAD